MRRLRLSIAQIMLLVLGIALAIGALRSPSPLLARVTWTATAALLCGSVIAAILRHEQRRAFWVGFAVFGWVHLVLIFELYQFGSSTPKYPSLPSLLTLDLIEYLRNYVPPPRTTFLTGTLSINGFPYLEFEQIARLLVTLFVAWIGGGLSRLAANWPRPAVPLATKDIN